MHMALRAVMLVSTDHPFFPLSSGDDRIFEGGKFVPQWHSVYKPVLADVASPH